MFLGTRYLTNAGTMAVYDTIAETIVLKQLDSLSKTFRYDYAVSSSDKFYKIITESKISFTLFEINVNFVSSNGN